MGEGWAEPLGGSSLDSGNAASERDDPDAVARDGARGGPGTLAARFSCRAVV